MQIHNLILEQRKYYKHLSPIYSHILKNTVYFTSTGFNHLLYKNHNHPRKISEQFMKLKCLKYAKTVIKNSKNIPSIRQFSKKINGKLKIVSYYELIYEVKSKAKVRVIIEKIGNGNYKFKSIMPNDNRSKRLLTKTKKHQ